MAADSNPAEPASQFERVHTAAAVFAGHEPLGNDADHEADQDGEKQAHSCLQVSSATTIRPGTGFVSGSPAPRGGLAAHPNRQRRFGTSFAGKQRPPSSQLVLRRFAQPLLHYAHIFR